MVDNTNNFDFELVSPEKKLMSEKTWQVTIPGEEGSFSVRSNHSALVSTIRPGVVEVIAHEGDAPTRIFIAGGFADVTATNCTILAEEAFNVEDLDKNDIEHVIADLEKKLSNAQGEIEASRYKKQYAIEKSKLAAVSGVVSA